MAISSGYSAEDLAKLGPDALTRKRMLAEALLAKSGGQRKIEHPLQGAAQMAEALVNGLRVRKLDQAETAGMKSGESAWEGLFGGSPSSPQAAMPMPGAATEMSGTSPKSISPSGSTGGIQISSSPDAADLNALLGDETRRATLPAGMRNNNPGNIKFVGQKVPGIVGPSVNTDQGDPQAVFDTPESGMQAMYSLLNKKYSGGKLTPNQMIAGNMGWTPGNYDAARNVARSMGIGPDDDIGFSDPARAAKFMRGLIQQEHGKSGGLYPESMILSAIGGRAPSQVASLDPAVGMPQAASPQIPPAAAAYVDPTISAPNAQPQQTAAIQPANGLPPLAPPREVGTPPVPPNAPAPQQMAQALTGGSPPPQNQGPSVQDLAKIIANPWVSDDKKKIAQVLLGKQLEQDDPMRQLQIQKLEREVNAPAKRDTSVINGRLVDNQTGKAIAEFPDKVKPTTNQQDYEYYEQREKSAGRQPLGPLEWEQAQRKAGATNVTTNVGEGDKFYENLDRKNAETFAAMSDAGIQARSKLGQINRLEGLFNNVPQGAEGAFKKIAGDWGIPIGDGTSDIQAASALLEKMVPDQRPPGSGTMSDADIKMFRASLPRIINQPGGNQLIFQTMRGIAQYEAQMGEIADQVADRAIKPAEARKLIRELKNPLEDFKIPEGSTPNEGFKELSPGVRFKKIGD